MEILKVGLGDISSPKIRQRLATALNLAPNTKSGNPNATPAPNWNRIFSSDVFVFSAVLLSIFKASIIIGILAPVFPKMMESLGFDGDALIYWNTLAYALQSVGYFVTALTLGYLSDRFVSKRKIMLLVFATLFAGAMGAFAFVRNAAVYMVVNVVIGTAQGATFVVGYAIVAGTFPPSRHARIFGVIFFAYTFGKLVGQIVGGVMADAVSLRSSLYLMIAISLLDIVGTALMNPQSTSASGKSTEEERTSSIKEIASTAPLHVVGATYFLIHITLLGFDSVYAIHLEDKFGMSPSKIGWFSMVYMIPFTIASPITGILADKFPKYNVIASGLVFHAVSVGLVFLAPTEATIAVAMAVFGASYVVGTVPFYPLMVSIAARAGLRNVLGQLSCLDGLLAGLGQIVGPLLVGAAKNKILFFQVIAGVIFVYAPMFIVLMRRFFREPRLSDSRMKDPSTSSSMGESEKLEFETDPRGCV
ncbi:hypothetical protein HK102_008180 [Quaeritorhiza haematococci]|nr:hypothetical protein HK102_008180 [Quaeritorhiza haematococci]